jgi:predicted AAA+ superfamily ATPase
MALSNRERVGRVMEALKDGLGPFILREFRTVYSQRGYINEIDAVLATPGYSGLPEAALSDDQVLLAALDTQACLNLMWRRWNDVFQDKLGHTARSYVSEMIGARNTWAHQGAFTNDEAYRIADTAARLLNMVTAPEQAAYVGDVARELLRLRFEAEAEKVKKEAVAQAVETTTLAGLKPWREVVQPHPDVAGGRYIQAEFAADLSQVIAGTAEPEYQDPLEFFRRTYLTEGLLGLLVTGVKRLTAQGGDPVVQLQTAFGGGKTHSMLALYHLCSGQIKLSDFPGGERIARQLEVAQIGDVDLPEANVAVLVGTALNPSQPREYPDATVHTLWGEMAYQLGGSEGYRIVEQADLKGVNPGSDTLGELLFKFGPCLIIIDELVAYARNLYGVDRLPAGSFDTIMSFVQSLTEAVKRADESILLVSIPASEIEIGGEAGRTVLETLSHIVGRIESVWKPITATESFEIVCRRLFATDVDAAHARFAARDAVINAFGDMYRNASGEFPAGVPERDYLDRMRSAYPIHPELFDRLYQDWSTLERFQRTRGVLRLMAAVIHQLWTRGDQSLLIMPGTVPLDTTPVRNEILRYLPDTWDAVYDTDIDGPASRPFTIDGDVPALGRYSASRRVARTTFIGSAPSVAGQQVRGLEEIRIRLGCAQPGEPAAVFGDALRRMSGQLTYLYTDGSRYWYDTRPTVNKLARDRAQGFPQAEVNAEITARLRRVPKNADKRHPSDFAAFHVAPPDTSDVVDEARARIVVLDPEFTHKRTNGASPAMQEARRFLESRGNAQRLYKNMLMFIAPDAGDAEALRLAVRDFLAWQSIHDEREELNLDAQQRRQVSTSLQKADETVDLRLRATYSWLLVPVQPDPLGAIELQASRISGDDNFYDRAARKLRNDGLLITEWSPDILRMELDRYIWSDERGWEVGLKQLWEYLAQYCYLPRLFDHEVLVKAVKDGVGRLDAPFAYATGKSEQGYHTGLVIRSLGTIYFDDTSILVHPDHVIEPPEVKVTPPPDVPIDRPGVKPTGKPKPAKKALSRYYGRVEIDSQRVNKDIGLIVEEVIERLTSQVGCEVEITLEIDARRPEGFDESTVRTISENSRTLKFEHYGFEEE